MIRNFDINDAPQLLSIYNHYVVNTYATLDTSKANLRSFTSKLAKIKKFFPFIVIENEGKVVGYAYASEWKAKHGYSLTVETTIYIDPSVKGIGFGTQLYRVLISELKKLGYRVAIGCLTLPNAGSVGLHEKMGFIKVAHFPGIAIKFDKKVDVGYWQLNIL